MKISRRRRIDAVTDFRPKIFICIFQGKLKCVIITNDILSVLLIAESAHVPAPL